MNGERKNSTELFDMSAVAVVNKCLKILKQTGMMWHNIGSSYAAAAEAPANETAGSISSEGLPDRPRRRLVHAKRQRDPLHWLTSNWKFPLKFNQCYSSA